MSVVGGGGFAAFWRDARARVDAELEALLAREDPAFAAALGPALAGGQRFRPALLLLVHEALGPRDPVRALRHACALELLHTATLVHDDVVDGDATRRGAPAAHAALRSGAGARAPAMAVLLGDAAVALGLGLLREPDAGEAAERAVKQVWVGAWKEATQPWSEDAAQRKTAPLFRLACELGALAARQWAHLEDAARYGEHLGLAYQLADDAVDRPRGAPPGLAALARAEAERAVQAARALPPGPARALLEEAPRALLCRALPEAAP